MLSLMLKRLVFIVKHKKEAVANYKSIGLRQGCGKQDMIPLSTELRKLRKSLGYSLGEIQSHVLSYGNYEKKGLISKESLTKVCNYYSSTDIGLFLNVLDKIRCNSLREVPKTTLNAVLSKLKNEELIEECSNEIIITNKGNNTSF